MNFSLYKKYIFWGLGGVAVLVVAGTLIYSLMNGSGSGAIDGGLFPLGGSRTVTPINQDGTDTTDNSPAGQSTTSATTRLFMMHERPIVSAISFMRRGDPYVRFIEQGTGFVYEYDYKNRNEYRISNTSVPQIAEAFWSQSGTVVAFRYESTGVLKSAVAELSTSTQESSFKRISFLPEGIQSLALSPDGENVAYIIPGSNAGEAIGVIARRDGSSPRIVFTGKLPRWFVSWPSPTSILITSPDSETGGVVYRIDPRNGTQTIVYLSSSPFMGALGGPKGELLIMNPQTQQIAQVGERGALNDTGIVSWPNLCTFVQSATSTLVCSNIPPQGPNLAFEWKRGEYDFRSDIFAYYPSDEYSEVLLTVEQTGDKVLDVTSLVSAPDFTFTAFINRVDGLLWGLSTPR